MAKLIKMKCENCGAMMEVDEDKKYIVCPYCGSKELIVQEEDQFNKFILNLKEQDHQHRLETEKYNHKQGWLGLAFMVAMILLLAIFHLIGIV